MVSKYAEYKKRYRAEHKAKKLCIYCVNMAIPGLTTCVIHNWRKKFSDHKYYTAHTRQVIQRVNERKKCLIEQGKCISCGRPLDETSIEEGTGKLCIGCYCIRQTPGITKDAKLSRIEATEEYQKFLHSLYEKHLKKREGRNESCALRKGIYTGTGGRG